MNSSVNVGDKALNVGYLKYIGDSQNWLNVNMKPFETIVGISECSVWNKTVTCFSVQHTDVKELARIPMHRDKIFDINTGFDMDRQLNQYLSVNPNKETIKVLVKSSIEANIAKRNNDLNEKIAYAEREIIKLKKEIESHTTFCNECGDYILNECDTI
jgi:hypothetical protein